MKKFGFKRTKVEQIEYSLERILLPANANIVWTSLWTTGVVMMMTAIKYNCFQYYQFSPNSPIVVLVLSWIYVIIPSTQPSSNITINFFVTAPPVESDWTHLGIQLRVVSACSECVSFNFWEFKNFKYLKLESKIRYNQIFIWLNTGILGAIFHTSPLAHHTARL